MDLKSPVIIVLMGPPGGGKGTHGEKLSKHLQIPHISVGDLFRDNIKKDTTVGKKAKSFIEKGLLVPDEIVFEMLDLRMQDDDCKNGFILDGFPRNIYQADMFDKKMQTFPVMVLNLALPDTLILDRIINRQVCSKCGSTFHKIFVPSKKENICDSCGSDLYQRKDDTEEVVKERLLVYHNQTAPVLDYYRKKNLLLDIDAQNSVEEVFKNLINTIEKSRQG